MLMTAKKTKQYAVCVYNRGYEVSLEKRKIYQVTTDKTAEQKSLLRVKDESGQTYLYPAKFFILIKLPQTVAKVFGKAA